MVRYCYTLPCCYHRTLLGLPMFTLVLARQSTHVFNTSKLYTVRHCACLLLPFPSCYATTMFLLIPVPASAAVVWASVMTPQLMEWQCLYEPHIGPYTFQEAFDRTGRIINITVAPLNQYDPPRLLNYLTAPHVCVWSAVAASCALPGNLPCIR